MAPDLGRRGMFLSGVTILLLLATMLLSATSYMIFETGGEEVAVKQLADQASHCFQHKVGGQK